MQDTAPLYSQFAYTIMVQDGALVPIPTGGHKTGGRIRRTGASGAGSGAYLQPKLTPEQRTALAAAAEHLTQVRNADAKRDERAIFKAQDVARATLARIEIDPRLMELLTAELAVLEAEFKAARNGGRTPRWYFLPFDTSAEVQAALVSMALDTGAVWGEGPAPSRLVTAVASLWALYPGLTYAMFDDDDAALAEAISRVRADQQERIVNAGR